MTDSCSKMVAGFWKLARKATWRLRILWASDTNRLGKPSAKVLQVWPCVSVGHTAACTAEQPAQCVGVRPAYAAQPDVAVPTGYLLRKGLALVVVEQNALPLGVVWQVVHLEVWRLYPDVLPCGCCEAPAQDCCTLVQGILHRPALCAAETSTKLSCPQAWPWAAQSRQGKHPMLPPCLDQPAQGVICTGLRLASSIAGSGSKGSECLKSKVDLAC